jgi:hypothetical protein
MLWRPELTRGNNMRLLVKPDRKMTEAGGKTLLRSVFGLALSGPGFDSASNRNKYQVYFLGG